MALAVTQPYISKQHIELIDSNTGPAFNQLFSAHAFLAQAQQALRQLQNAGAAGTPQGSGADYIYPKNADGTSKVTSVANYKTNVDNAIRDITLSIKSVQLLIADCNS